MINLTWWLIISHMLLVLWALYERYYRMRRFEKYKNLVNHTDDETYHEHALDYFNIEIDKD